MSNIIALKPEFHKYTKTLDKEALFSRYVNPIHRDNEQSLDAFARFVERFELSDDDLNKGYVTLSVDSVIVMRYNQLKAV